MLISLLEVCLDRESVWGYLEDLKGSRTKNLRTGFSKISLRTFVDPKDDIVKFS